MKVYLSSKLSTDRTVLQHLEAWSIDQQRAWLEAYKRGDFDTVYSMLDFGNHCSLNRVGIMYDLSYAIEYGWTEDMDEVYL